MIEQYKAVGINSKSAVLSNESLQQSNDGNCKQSAESVGDHVTLESSDLSMVQRNKEAELFVGDLSFFCTEADLHQMFAPFGEIVKIRIKRSGATRRTLMYGFVIMSSGEEAHHAKDTLHGRRYMGRDIR
jgi:RNA recognition motif-containing protein